MAPVVSELSFKPLAVAAGLSGNLQLTLVVVVVEEVALPALIPIRRQAAVEVLLQDKLAGLVSDPEYKIMQVEAVAARAVRRVAGLETLVE